MRRGSIRAGKRSADSGGEQGFWPTYADMMSTVALILFFLMLISYIQNLITGNDLQNTQEVLADTRTQVSAAQAQLDDLSEELKLKQSEINGYTLQIDKQTETINNQKKLIGDQEKYLQAANSELLEMRTQMQSIAVLRMSILEQIRDSIVDVMGDESKVSVGDNGNIILNEGVFFDLGSAQIKPESEAVLNELIDVFVKFLSIEENAKYVDSIVISGHTDITCRDEPAAVDRQGKLRPAIPPDRQGREARQLRRILLRCGLRRDAPRRKQRHCRGTGREPPHRDIHDPEG